MSYGLRFFLTVPAALAAIWLAVCTAGAAEYKLGPADRLKLLVGDWRVSASELRDWSLFNSEFNIGPDGILSIPFAGAVRAEGLTAVELGAEVSERVKQTLGLATAPHVAVQVIEYRPIFVTGSVEKSGAYPYMPGLTVLKAISIAGGVSREDESSSADRDFISAQGSLSVLKAQRDRHLATQARLEAEIARDDEITPPEALDNHPNREALIASERSLMSARRVRLERQLEGLRDLKTLLETEIAALESKGEAQEEQLRLTREELESVSRLQERGLALNPRVRSIQQSVVETESKLLDIETAKLRARQELNRADQEAAGLESERAATLASEKQTIDAELEKIELEARSQAELMADALERNVARAQEAAEVRIGYTIVRIGGDGAREIVADENTEVLPGDVVRVTVRLVEAL